MRSTTMQDQKLKMAALILLLAIVNFLVPSVTAAVTVTRNCKAKWTPVTTQKSSLPLSFDYQFQYGMGLQHSLHSSGGEAEILVSIVAKLKYRYSNYSAEVQLAGSELSVASTRTGRVTVPAKGAITVWQLIAETEDRVFGFVNTAVTTSELEPPDQTVSCVATLWVRPLIEENSWFRLKHQSKGKYMVMTIRKGWDAATLGFSTQYRFRLVRLDLWTYKIIAETYTFSGYYYLYSSVGGGIYFDDYDSTDKAHMWRLSKRNPRDGDVVTFRNEYWPTAFLTYYEGSTTNIFCEDTMDPDKWIIELA